MIMPAEELGAAAEPLLEGEGAETLPAAAAASSLPEPDPAPGAAAGDAVPSTDVLEESPVRAPPAVAGAAPTSSLSIGSPDSASPQRRSSFEVLSSARSEPGGSTAPSKLRRMEQRTAAIRKLFSLQPSESLLEDFACALKKKILLQGRMYIFARHICFYSNLFGYVKVKVIPLADVQDVKKKKNVGFNNSIELTWLSGKKEFFTSFLNRAEAYRLIMAQWRECSDLAPPPPEPGTEEPCGGSLTARTQSVKRLLRGMSSLIHREPAGLSDDVAAQRSESEPLEDRVEDRRSSIVFVPHGTAHGVGPPQARLSSLAEEEEDAALPAGASGRVSSSSGGTDAGAGEPGGRGRGAERGRGGAALSPGQDADGSQLGSPIRLNLGGGGAGSNAAAAAAEGPHSPPILPNGAMAEQLSGGTFMYEFVPLTDAQCQREVEAEFGAAAEPPTPVDPELNIVASFDLACHPLEFWCRFLSNHCDWHVKFHASRGDTAIRASKWQRHFKVGLVRDLQFITPVKARIGPPQAMCHQTQRLRVCAGAQLLLETSQVMSDIPYSDHFSVETRWDVSPAPTGCHVVVRSKVNFTKSTMWRKFIEKGTADSMSESVQAWKEMAIGRLAAEPACLPVGEEPSNEAEWSALISQLDPHVRGVVPQHGRRHSRTGSFSLSPSVAGVPVGRQLPVLSRHRRNTSRVTDAMAAAVRLPHGLPPQSPAAGLSPQVSRGLGQMSPQVSLKLPEQLGSGGADAGSGGGAKQPQRSTSRVAAAAAAPFAALLRWLAGLAAALVGAARAHSGQFAVIAIGCIIIGLQLLLVLEQRQELAQLRALPLQQPSWQAGAGSCADTGSCGDVAQAAGQAAAALGREVASLQQALRQLQAASSSWQGQLEAATATAAKLAKSLQQLGR